jgi:hypothetical protein
MMAVPVSTLASLTGCSATRSQLLFMISEKYFLADFYAKRYCRDL